MYLYNFLQNLPSLAAIVEPDPLTVYPDLPLLEAIAMMSQRSNEIAAPHGVLLFVADELLVGIVTDRDLVKLTTTQANLQGLKVADVMTEQPHTLVLAGAQTVLSALSILQQYEIGHLPIVDAQGHLLGLVTLDLICQILQVQPIVGVASPWEDRATELDQTNRELRSEVARLQQGEMNYNNLSKIWSSGWLSARLSHYSSPHNFKHRARSGDRAILP
jgi:CBS domain-containing protein